MPEVVHKPQPGAQEDFLATSAQEVFFGGEAGGGKSWALLQDFLYDAGNPNANGIFFRSTFRDLEDIIFKSKDHFAGFGAEYKEAKHLYIFPSGARFRFSHLQHVNDIFTHAGQEYTHIDWDEICHFPRLPYTYLFSRLRTTDPTINTRVRTTGNPDGVGVLWVKARFIDKLKPYEIGFFTTQNDRDIRATPAMEKELFVIHNLPSKDRFEALIKRPELMRYISRQWIPTKRAENLALMKANPQYESMLDQLPEKQQRAYKLGKWDVTDRKWQVIATEWWIRALSGDVEKVGNNGAVGADYAESGDKCCTVSGRGNQVQRIIDYPGMKTHEFAQKVWDEHHLYGKYQCLTGVDSVGPGVGVYHKLDDMGLGDRIEGCRWKDDAFSSRYEKLALKLHFNNWRTQAIWLFHDDMEAGNIDLHLLQEEHNFYDNLHLLQEEALIHTYKIDNGVVKIISKEELRKEEYLGRSPDRFDALVIWNWMRHRNGIAHARRNLDYTDPYNQINVIYKKDDRTEATSWT